MPKVSVIINCLNCSGYLREALDSVFNQTFDDWEVIFWDNASTDDSASIAKSYGERLRYFCSDRTYTLGKARNLAFSQARGDYIAILDSDDIWLPTKLERQIPLFDKNPKVGLIFSDTIIFDERGDKYRYFQFVRPERGRVFGPFLSKNFISSETITVRRTFFEKLSKQFDEEFTIVMDRDLSLRMAHDYELDYVEDVLSKFRVHVKSESSRKRELLGKENEKLMIKLKKQYPEIESDYKTEIEKFEKKIHYQRAMSEWQIGGLRTARKYFCCHLNDKKFLMLYILTLLLPYRMVEFSKKCVRYIISKFVFKLAR